MVFGPPWNERYPTAGDTQKSDELLPEVRAAADELFAELKRAEHLSGRWSNEKLTDALVDAALSRCLGRLGRTGCWGEANRLPSSELWRIAGPLLEAGSLQAHARFKPRGYAGDFEMLRRIWEQSCCDDPLGRAFDCYFLRQAAPQAVRSRMQQTAAALVSHRLGFSRREYHVTSVGSGPAIDVAEALAMLPEDRRGSLRVTLLELDAAALDDARGRLEPLLPSGALSCVRTNLFRLAKRADRDATLGSPSFLICSGLFDYLDDEPAVAMLQMFWRQLVRGGILLVGNFAPHNPTRAYMEWIGNWYLTYRTAEQMARLATRAGIPQDRFTIGCERLGVDLFLIARRHQTDD